MGTKCLTYPVSTCVCIGLQVSLSFCMKGLHGQVTQQGGRMAESRRGGRGRACVIGMHQWLKLRAKIPGRVCGKGFGGKGRFGAG